MSKIGLIIKREYLTRVRKKSFIIMSILGPVLMAALIVVPVILTTMAPDNEKKIAVADYTGTFKDIFKEQEQLKFNYINLDSVESLKSNFSKSGYYALLVLPDSANGKNVQLLSDVQPDINTKMSISRAIEGKLRSEKLKEIGIDEDKLNAIETDVNIKTIKINSDGSEEISSTEVIMGIGFITGLIIYMFIFIYGAQVMRGVLEEKTNRVVEILVSSVKPFQLMMGKIIGVAMVALTQVALWVILSTIIISVVLPLVGADNIKPEMTEQMVQGTNMPQEMQNINNGDDFLSEAMSTFTNLPIGELLFSFVFFFIGGYLLYASLFAAIGGAVDNETDTQQFMLPITVPLILSIVMAQVVIQNPNGAVAFWFSIIPFTSPVIMLLRIPFGVPGWELALSMVLLIATFIGTTWLAGKIYRVGILMYGKKVSYKEIWKWLRYSG
ncbi:MAG: ABC transporter permease [Bacteroidales bacterium]|nr:ABC transporter permease [Bacteroidales bacterium]